MANIFYAQRGLSPCGNDCGPAPFKNAAAFPRAGPGIFGRAVCGHFSPVARMCGGGGTGMKNRNPPASRISFCAHDSNLALLNEWAAKALPSDQMNYLPSLMNCEGFVVAVRGLLLQPAVGQAFDYGVRGESTMELLLPAAVHFFAIPPTPRALPSAQHAPAP